MSTTERMNLTEAAAYMGKSERTLLRMIQNGELVGYKNGGRWNLDKSDLDGYVEAQKQKVREKAAERRQQKVS